ncbi:MAG: GntR family transcriptional regulator, partial [Chloroflexota bacterium]
MLKEINRDIPVPLYYQISQQIRQQIEAGELKLGQQIPTEKELQEIFEVSRSTIRQAIAELVYAGLLERRSTQGTFVARSKLEETVFGFGSFTNEMMKRGMIPESRILDFKFIPSPEIVAHHLQLEHGVLAAAMERLRIVNGQPVAVENWYAPAHCLPGLERSDFKETGKEQSTYYMLRERFNISLFRAEDSISAVALEARDARLLHLETGMPALLRTRVSYGAGDVPIVFASGVYII